MRRNASRRLRIPFGAVCAALAVGGYGLEWIRQRGDCDLGDKSPDTLGISIAMIVLVGGLLGLVSLIAALFGVWRHGFASRKWNIVSAVVSILLVGPLFMFAGAGPGSWFQYCGT